MAQAHSRCALVGQHPATDTDHGRRGRKHSGANDVVLSEIVFEGGTHDCPVLQIGRRTCRPLGPDGAPRGVEAQNVVGGLAF